MIAADLSNSKLLKAATRYRDVGMCALPANRSEKRPTLATWKDFQSRLPEPAELTAWFSNGCDAVCLVAGSVSGNLELIDFDRGGELFEAWANKIPPDLFDKLVIESSQSGGHHVAYRCQEPVSGNLKLAQRRIDDSVITLIETRGEGGLLLCAPTSGYELVQGELTKLSELTVEERETLLFAARELNEYWVQTPSVAQPVGPCGDLPSSGGSIRPGDDFNARGDVVAMLKEHGWQPRHKSGDGNQHWTRPGKSHGTSATLKDGTFYVFSSNAHPFEPNSAYSAFGVLAMLEHDGDFEQAARSLSEQGYGCEPTLQGVDLSGFLEPRPPRNASTGPPDPGLLVDEMLRVPGFISEVMDHCLETAPYPNPVMAFCGALALLSFLAGRKVRDPGDNRTNLYLLGLAHSSAGKDWPRKINVRILHEIGQADCVGERFASGEGIQDSLLIHPATLFQTDEIDGILQSINKSRDARYENIMSTLLTLYSSANSVFPMRRKAGGELPGVIDQPCLTIFGTAIPNHYYEALSERMLTNGFFARMLLLECGRRGTGQEPSIREIPERVLETARWWTDFRPGSGNLEDHHPVPMIVEQTDEAKRILVDAREQAEAEYTKAEVGNDAVGTTVWGRVSEHTRKLALLYAVSENCHEPEIGGDAARWAVRFVMHQTRRMLFMAHAHVADNPFHADCLKLMKKLRDAPDKTLSHSLLLKRMKIDSRTFLDIVNTLEQRGDVAITVRSTAGRPSRCYQLLENSDASDEGQGVKK